MERTRAEAFNEEVERYRKALLYYAKKCDWETFKAKAGRLFDYLETIEMSEIERRFFVITRIIVIALVFVVLFIWRMDAIVIPEQEGVRRLVVLMALGMSSFELYFYVNFLHYRQAKRTYYGKRREQFISLMEQDFRTMVLQQTAG